MPTAPLSPYGAQKLFAETYCRMFTRVYGLETASLRYFNVFGPRQDATSQYSGVFAKFIPAVLQDRVPTIYGDGLQSRDFTYVSNVVAANLMACTAPGIGGEANGVRRPDHVENSIQNRSIGSQARTSPQVEPRRTSNAAGY
jgi:UDP-glucose 4-epimerase